ncbi:MAG: hypothetical protein IPK53_05400 [bacterium]|nr:hypothetical protein [bacterium]
MTAQLSWFEQWDRAVFGMVNQLFTSSFFDAIMPALSDMRLWMIPLGLVWVIFFFRTKRRAHRCALLFPRCGRHRSTGCYGHQTRRPADSTV